MLAGVILDKQKCQSGKSGIIFDSLWAISHSSYQQDTIAIYSFSWSSSFWNSHTSQCLKSVHRTSVMALKDQTLLKVKFSYQGINRESRTIFFQHQELKWKLDERWKVYLCCSRLDWSFVNPACTTCTREATQNSSKNSQPVSSQFRSSLKEKLHLYRWIWRKQTAQSRCVMDWMGATMIGIL